MRNGRQSVYVGFTLRFAPPSPSHRIELPGGVEGGNPGDDWFINHP